MDPILDMAEGSLDKALLLGKIHKISFLTSILILNVK